MRTKPKIEIDLAEVEKVAQVCDNDEQIAHALGISYRTLYNRKREYAEFAEAIKRGRSKGVVFVASKLYEAVRKGNITAMIFYLKCKGGWKEVQKLELTGKDGNAIEVDRKDAIKDVSTDQLLEIVRMNGNDRMDEKGSSK